MSSPGLRKVSCRRQLTEVANDSATSRSIPPSISNHAPHLHASSLRLLPQVYKNRKARSESEVAVACLSEDESPTSSRKTFKKTFPCMTTLLGYLKRASSKNDPISFCNIASHFLNTIYALVSSIDKQALLILHEECEYLIVRETVQLLLHTFSCSRRRVQTCSPEDAEAVEDLNESYDCAAILYDSLECLFRIGYFESWKNKPLPPLPAEFTDALLLEYSGSSSPPPEASIKDAFADPEPEELPVSSSEEADQLTSLVKHPQSGNGTTGRPKPPLFLHRQLKGNASSGKSTFSTQTGISTAQQSTTTTLVGSGNSTLRPIIRGRPMQFPEAIYEKRRTARYFGEDVVILPEGSGPSSPVDENDGIHFDQQGRIKSAESLTALIRALTSVDGPVDDNFRLTIFTCFRFFSNPHEFFQELVKRYEEPCPDGLSLKDHRQWFDQSVQTRIRVLAVLSAWLKQHWKPETDNEVLGEIQAFLLKCRKDSSVDSNVLERILSKVEALENPSDDEGFARQRKDIAEHCAARKTQKPPSPTGFKFPSRYPPSLYEQLMLFNNKAGREEFARQLTMMMSALYQTLTPDDAVSFWYRTGGNKGPQNHHLPSAMELISITKTEKALSRWTTSSIVSSEKRSHRTKTISFWADVAWRCNVHRNYSASFAIYSGVVHSAVSRMKETVLALPVRRKAQVYKLGNFFDFGKNYTPYRMAVTKELLPTLPFTGPLIKDLVHASLIPTAAKNEKKRLQAEQPEGNGARKGDRLDSGTIYLSGIHVVADTVKICNKALMPYDFYANEGFLTWLDKYISPLMIYNEDKFQQDMDHLSHKLEPTNPALYFVHVDRVWRCSAPAAGPFTEKTVSVVDFEIAEVSNNERRAKARCLLSLIKCMKAKMEKKH